MSEHTPGPWIYKATAGNHDYAVYPELTGRDLALVRDFNEANARLIAAAPDLLEAWNDYFAAQAKERTNGTTAEVILGYVDACKKARAAIAKATTDKG